MLPLGPEPNDEEKLEEVEGDDGSTPFSLPDDISGAASQSTHPQTDAMHDDAQQLYDEGIPASAGLPENPTETNATKAETNEGFDVEPTENDV